MYTVNIYYCYYILHHLCIISVIPHPFFPISATFLQFIPASFLPFPALFLPVPALLFPLLDHSFSFLLFLSVLAPFPFIQFLLLFSKFDLLPFYLFLPPSLSCFSFFPSSYFPALFTFPVYLSHLVHCYLLSSFFSYLSSSCPFFYAVHASFSLFLSPLPTSYSHYSIFSVLIPQFPCPSIQFQCVFC